MSIFKDTRTLAAQVVEMVEAIMKGEEAPVNDTETYHNGVKSSRPSSVSRFMPMPTTIELLIDSGYYTEARSPAIIRQVSRTVPKLSENGSTYAGLFEKGYRTWEDFPRHSGQILSTESAHNLYTMGTRAKGGIKCKQYLR